jgi:hypothetical protein
MFPDLSERTVEISHHDKIFTVPKLSILQYSRIIEIINTVERTGKINTACKELWILLETVLPEEILKDCDIFAYNDLVELCMYLAFGSYFDDTIQDSGQKYYETSTLPDYQFKAARILSQFSAYTLEKLLNEPASIFFALSDYADRISADNALEIIAEGVKAAFTNFKQLSAKRGSLTIPNPNCTQTDILLEYKNVIL